MRPWVVATSEHAAAGLRKVSTPAKCNMSNLKFRLSMKQSAQHTYVVQHRVFMATGSFSRNSFAEERTKQSALLLYSPA
jgi:hypothetical protein